MTKINIIPEKIPNQFWEKKQFEDLILYALGVHGPLKREDFINNKDKGIKNRMNKNTFHKWAKKLKNKHSITVSREKKYSIYTITGLGLKILLRKLKTYNLDMRTILNLERKTTSKRIARATTLFKNVKIRNKNVMIEFLKLKNEITRDNLRAFPEEKFNRALLYLTLNHPRYYDYFGSVIISIEDFIAKYANGILSKDELKWFLHKIEMKKISNISFHKLKLADRGINLYFRATEEYGRIFEITIQAILRDHYYIHNLSNDKCQEIIINEICEEALTLLINKYNLFHKDLERSLYKAIKYYLLSLLKNLKRKVSIKSFDLYEIPTLIMTSEIFDFERLDYLQKRALFHLEAAYNETMPIEYRENIKNAKEYIQKAIDFDKNNSYNYAIKAQILHFTGEYVRALEAIHYAIKLDPEEAKYYSDLGFFLSWQNKYEKALKSIYKAIKLEPYIAVHYSDLANILISLNQYEKALNELNLAIDKDPQNIRYYIKKSNCLAFNLQQYEFALKVIERALQLNPEKLELFEIYKAKAGILLYMKNDEAALKIIRKARHLYPDQEIYPNLH